ncbi:SCO family protein [Hwanghaeella grinnelliae]|uniref:SCO family protein n=1 Tax=Hwanghaeella grinnelliae TaxID=2500179 RepID=A0A437QPF5_9PROT|nr:SCO family protein [Hwanghaeella grinnelliae]RVU36365.1 SCO family protein [Hwanghaeella grinnelliae]
MRRILTSPVFVALVAGIMAVVAVGFIAWQQFGGSQGSLSSDKVIVPATDIRGDFNLVNSAGDHVTPGDFPGQYLLVYFGYSYCPDVCPTDLAIVGQAMDILEESDATAAAKVQPIFITVDPARDGPDTVGVFAETFHPRLVGLTGTDAEIADAASSYRVYYARRDMDDGNYLMDHSAFTYLVGPDGAVIGIFKHDTAPEDMAEGMADMVAG